MKCLRKCLQSCVVSLLFAVLFPTVSYAENCDNLDSNRTWVNTFEKLQMHVGNGEFDEALADAEVLFRICSMSPAANYYTARALDGKGEHVKATQYYQRASEYTSDFAVAPEMSRIIWYARYEAEYPERSEAGFAQKEQQIADLQEQIANRDARIAEKSDENQRLKDAATSYIAERRQNEHDKYSIIMWSGAGLGLLGIGMAVAGGLYAFNAFDFDVYEDVTNDEYTDQRKYKISNFYRTGWAIFGAGISMAVVGAVLAGFGGYQYTHPGDDFTVSVQVSPVSAGLTMQF